MKSFIKTLTLVLALLLGWTANAQVGDLIFSTGVDTTQWLALSSSATTFTGPASASGDSYSPGVQQIGFTFNFAGVDYTQFSCNSDGNLRFGSTVTGTSNYTQPFSSTNAGTNGPKINGMGRDGRMAEGSSPYTNHAYIKHEVQGTAPNRVLVVEYHNASYSTSPSPCTETYFQVQLYETTNIVKLVYGQRPAQTTTTGFQIGLATSASDVATINSRTHTVSYGATTTLNTPASTSDTACYPEQGRYYQFAPSTCHRPTIVDTEIGTDEITVTWSPNGEESEWEVIFGTDTIGSVYDTTYTFSDLTPNTPYLFQIRSVCGTDEYSSWGNLSIRTACAPIDSLPYSYGFEDATAASSAGLIDPCWKKGTNNTTAYPYPSSTAHTGTRSLNFYSTTNYYSYAVLPAFEEELQNLLLYFWSKSTSTSYTGALQVGVMTDPEDITTFQLVATATPNSTVWTEHIVGFSSYEGEGGYIALLLPNTGTNGAYLDDITVEVAPSCPRIVELDVPSVTAGSALVTWDYDHNMAEEAPYSYSIVLTDSDSTQTVYTDAVSPFIISGLEPGSLYQVKVIPICSEENGWADSTEFTTVELPCLDGNLTDVTVGDGTSTTYYFPTNSFYNYSLTQTIYDASFFSTAGPINKIAVNCSTPSSTAPTRTIKIFMDTTSISTFASSTSMIPQTDSTLVFSGSVTWVTGWNVINLTTPFNYDGTSNIIVTFEDNTGTYSSSYFYYTSASNKGIYINSDSYNMDADNPYGTSATNTLSSYRINMQFLGGTCNQYGDCAAPAVAVDSVSTTTANIVWVPGYQETSWTMEYRTVGEENWTMVATGMSDNNYELTNLTSSTPYEVRVSVDCGDTILYGTATFRTECAPLTPDQLPYYYGFDDATVAGSAGQIDPCWYKATTGSTAYYPYPSSSQKYDGIVSMYFYSPANTITWLATPEFEDSISNLRVSFWLYKSSSTYVGLKLGVMTDVEDFSTFTPLFVANPSTTGTWTRYEYDFDNYTGPQGRIVFVSNATVANYAYLDGVTIEHIPACGNVENLAVSNITPTTAMVSWTPSRYGTPSSYSCEYRLMGDQSWTVNTTTDPYYFLTGLTSNNPYEVRVRVTCEEDTCQGYVYAVFATHDCLQPTGEVEPEITVTNYCYRTPQSALHNYSFSQQIYNDSLLADINSPIHSLSFYNNYDVVGVRTVDVYLGHSAVDTFATTSVIPFSSLTKVADSASFYMHQGWCSVAFNTVDFTYNGTDNLVVAMVDRTGTNLGANSGWYGGQMNSPVAIWGASNDAFTGSLDSLVGTSQTILNNVIFGYGCANVTCAAPAVVLQNASQSQIDIAWMPGLNETSWQVEYKVAADANWILAGVVNAPTYSFTNLNASTDYMIRVGSVCSDTMLYGEITARTACGPVDLPIMEDFEIYPNNTQGNPCWTYAIREGNVMPYTVNITSNSHMVLAPLGSYVAMPEVADSYTMSNLQVRFAYLAAVADVSVAIGVMSDPTDPTTFVGLDTITTADNLRNNYVVALTGAPDSCRYVTLLSLNNNAYIDEIILEETPACLPPVNITSVTTTTSATLSWTEASALPVGNYVVEYGTIGFTVGTGTVDSVAGTGITLSALNPGTTYEVYVFAACSTGDISYATHFSFTTECVAITAADLPYTMSFENIGAPVTQYTGILPNCWNYTMLATSTTANIQPQVHRESSYATGGDYCMRMYYKSVVALPEIDASVNISDLQLSFDDYATSTYYGLIVGVVDSVTPGFEASFVGIDTIYPANTSHNHYTVYFFDYQGSGKHIAFQNFYTTSTTINYSYHYIDNVQIAMTPSCLPVQQFYSSANTSSSVDLAWTDLRGATEWEMAMDTIPQMANATRTVISTNPYTVSGLNPGQDYYFWIRSICSAGDSSAWVGPLHLVPGTWNMRANHTDTITMCGGVIYDDGGVNGDYSASQNSYLIVRPENPGDLIEVNGTLVRMESSSYDYLRIYAGEGTTGTLLWSWTPTTAGGPVTIPSCISEDGPVTLYFHTDGSGQYAGFELNVNCITVTCPAVSDLTATSSEEGTMEISWTSNGSESEWEVELDGNSQLVNTTNVTFNNLTAGGSYQVRVRPICSVGDTGLWQSINFFAPCGPVVDFPWTENFDSYSAQATSYSTAGILPNCWMAYTNGTSASYYPHIVNTGSYWYSPDGSESLVMTSGSGASYGSDKYVALPQFASDFADLSMTFWYKNESATNGTLYVGYFTSTDLANSFVPVRQMPNNTSGVYDSVSFDSINDPNALLIGFHWYYNSTFYSVCIDNVTVNGVLNLSPCRTPQISDVTNVTYQGATVNWTGLGDNYEVAVLQNGVWSSETPVQGYSYTFTGLQPETVYQYRVRQDCQADELGYSDWATGSFTTDSLPCMIPEDLTATEVTGTTATLTWNAISNETSWEVRYAAQGDTASLTANATTFTVTGLFVNVTYTAWVRALCGDGTVVSDWSQPVEFTTTPCPMPTNVTANDVTTTGATISWTAPEGYNDFTLYYGITENTNNMTPVEVTGTSHTLSGLESNTTYYVSISTRCAEGWVSDLTANISFRTTVGIDDVNANSVSLYPNPATTQVTIEGYEGEVQIVDMTGRVVLRSNDTTIDISTLTAGAYFVKLGTTVKKLIVK